MTPEEHARKFWIGARVAEDVHGRLVIAFDMAMAQARSDERARIREALRGFGRMDKVIDEIFEKERKG